MRKAQDIVLSIGAIFIALGFICTAIFIAPDHPNWQLEAVQYGYGRLVDGQFEWVSPEEWSPKTQQRVDRRIEALVPESP